MRASFKHAACSFKEDFSDRDRNSAEFVVHELDFYYESTREEFNSIFDGIQHRMLRPID